MRESLTILAGLLVLLLVAALVGPYLVDWSAQRSWIESSLSQAVGAKVEVRGPIEVRLLPSPKLVVGDVEIEGDSADKPVLAARRAEFELGLTPLMRGEVQLVDARIDAPKLNIRLGPNGSIVLPHAFQQLPGPVQFQQIVVSEGTISIDDEPNARQLTLENINADAEADSLSGPFKGDGSFANGGSIGAFHFSTSSFAGGRLPLKLIADASSAWPRIELDGSLVLDSQNGAAAKIAYDGNAALSGALAGPGGQIPWRLAAAVKADVHQAKLDGIDLRIGGDDHPIDATGTGSMSFDTSAHATLTLAAQQVDIDALLNSKPAGGQGSAPNGAAGAQLSDVLASALADPAFAQNLPMPVSLNMTAVTLTLGGQVLTDMAAGANLHPGAPMEVKLAGKGPGRSQISLAGTLETGAAALFRGHAAANIGDPAGLSAWLRPALPDVAQRLASLPVHSLSIAGDMAISGVSFSGRGLTIAADRSKLAGSVDFNLPTAADRGRLVLDLTSDALDLDGLPDIAQPVASLGDTDLSLALKARAVRVTRVGDAMVDAGSIALKMSKSGDAIHLDNLSIANLGGATLALQGDESPTGGHIKADIDAAQLGDLVALVRRIAPGPLVDALAARAESWSPAKVSLTAAAAPGQNGLALTSLALDGTVHGTHVQGSASPDASTPKGMAINLSLDATDAAVLLRQLGLDTLPLNGFGSGKIALAAHGAFDSTFDTTIDATLAGTEIGFAGQLSGALPRPKASGTLHLKTPNVSPLLAVMAVAMPDLSASVPADVSGGLNLDAAGLTLRGLTGNVAGAAISGDLAVAAAPSGAAAADATPALTGNLHFDRLPFTALASLALGPLDPTAAPAPPTPRSPSTVSALARGAAPASSAAPAWSSVKFLTGLAAPPATDVALAVDQLDFGGGFSGQNAKLNLTLAPGVVTLDNLAFAISGGSATGKLLLRRDGQTASVSGAMQWNGIPINSPAASGALSGALEFTSTGQSLSALMGSLAGGGTLHVAQLHIPRADPDAIGRIVALTDQDSLNVDEPEVTSRLALELTNSALVVDDASFEAGLANGVLRLTASGAPIGSNTYSANVTANFDFRNFVLDENVALQSKLVPKNWSGDLPAASVEWKGTLPAPSRTVNASALFASLSSRAIAAEQARIDAFDADNRERAFFTRRLNGLRYLRQRDQEIAAFLAEKARQAAAEAARQQAAADAPPAPSPAVRVAPGPPLDLTPPTAPPDLSGFPQNAPDPALARH